MIPREDPLDFIRPPTGRCLGAVFVTHDCDLRFFESVLITLLPIHTDPQADPDRFLDEGRRRLRETPVIVAMDARRYRGRQRLPHDLILIRGKRAFQPKLSLLLFESHALLAVGSSNLNEGGYGGNAELQARIELDYRKDSALLHRAAEVVAGCGVHGQTWERFMAQLRLLTSKGGTPPEQPWLLATTPEASVLEQFLARIPKKAKIERVGVMVASQSEDDDAEETPLYETLIGWLATRRAGDVPFDVALAWEAPALAPTAESRASDRDDEESSPEPEALIEQVCARSEGLAGGGTTTWFVPRKVQGQSVICQVGNRTFKLGKRKLAADLAAQRLWPVEEVLASGPMESLQYIAEHAVVDWWLFPELRLEGGAVYRRPLHAKVVVVATRQGKRKRTHLLIGAPHPPPRDLPREALTEAGLYLTRDTALTLPDLNDELIPCPAEALYLTPSSHATVEPMPPSGLEEAIFDAERHSLTLNWHASRVHRRVIYAPAPDRESVVFDGECSTQNVVPDFELERAGAELRVVLDGARDVTSPVPIRVINAAQLLAEEPDAELSFSELVHLRGAGSLPRSAAAEVGDAEVGWGELGPPMVFRALAALVAEVADSGPSLGAFEVALSGPVGVRRFAERLLQAEADPQLRASEAWVYGHELVRELRALRFEDDRIGRAKRASLEAFIGELSHRLALFAPTGQATAALKKFYKLRAG